MLRPASPAVRMLVPGGSGFATEAAATGARALRSRRSASSWACAVDSQGVSGGARAATGTTELALQCTHRGVRAAV